MRTGLSSWFGRVALFGFHALVYLPGRVGDISKYKSDISMQLLVHYLFLFQKPGLIFREDWKETPAETPDWEVSTFVPVQTTWRKLTMEGMTEGVTVKNPDLSNGQKIGITDLMRGGGSPAFSRLDWLEVCGKVRQ